jgi:hypothetical protein
MSSWNVWEGHAKTHGIELNECLLAVTNVSFDSVAVAQVL